MPERLQATARALMHPLVLVLAALVLALAIETFFSIISFYISGQE